MFSLYLKKTLLINLKVCVFILANIFCLHLVIGQQKQESSAISTEQKQEKTLSESEKRLLEQQVEKEIVQTEFFRQQIEKIKEPKTFWQSVNDNPTAVISRSLKSS